jgi:hypothetical protein
MRGCLDLSPTWRWHIAMATSSDAREEWHQANSKDFLCDKISMVPSEEAWDLLKG